ncbi:hypothetical protein KKH27_04790 [bacterium]|nr:hypothetical protein [bacterium]MBU1983550.1 hypothetical protein [bacterium]
MSFPCLIRIAFPVFLLLALLTAAGGCKQSKDASKSSSNPSGVQAKPAPRPEMKAEPVLPQSHASADELRNLVADQRKRAEETRREIAALGDQSVRDPEDVRRILLRRKGEILKAQKQVRLSDQLTPAQKDSLLKPLEQESIQISTQLLSVPR